MKKLIYIIMMIIGMSFFSACDSDVDLPVMTEEEYPRIMGRWPDKTGNELGVFGAQVGVDFSIVMQFTPSNLCEGIWYLDGVEYCRGTVFEYHSGQPVKHNLKLVVTTPKYTTSREAILNVTN
ncbi:hypothetical protein [Dysgonomonas sp. BGC7]|uniref:hypothetical protein n=1 Tax=Dysgonomonas sp. BGC7 TaxID=1658008 RepID=UPI000B0E16BF|nr:hypothetical protein [Dysgonomonas sp. BGC7]